MLLTRYIPIHRYTVDFRFDFACPYIDNDQPPTALRGNEAIRCPTAVQKLLPYNRLNNRIIGQRIMGDDGLLLLYADYDQRRGRIVERAARLFARDGFLGSSISELADACRISKSAIYHYYPSKEDILFDVMRSHVVALEEAALDVAGRTDRITTEIAKAGPFYFAEDVHQQYLAKNPGGYCGLRGTGMSCAIG